MARPNDDGGIGARSFLASLPCFARRPSLVGKTARNDHADTDAGVVGLADRDISGLPKAAKSTTPVGGPTATA